MFHDRADAGRRLAAALAGLHPVRPVVLALPRGGVPVAAQIAQALGAPLDIVAVRKLGAVGQPELAVGAIAEQGAGVIDQATVRTVGMTEADVDRTLARERDELERRVAAYRAGRPPIPLRGRTAIVVDDGMATGLTMLAALRAVHDRGAERTIVAVPVASPSAARLVDREADDVLCVAVPADLRSVGSWYERFDPVPDAQVVALLAAAPDDAPATQPVEETVSFAADGGRLTGDLVVPPQARALVVFAHGSGSSRLSPRNRAVAASLNRHGLATLLVDLLTEAESASRAAVFDIALLADRLESVTGWAVDAAEVAGLPIAYFGASTGAAAALRAAAELDGVVRAVVSRGGRPDLAAGHLPRVTAPTLLIVGSRDVEVLALNRQAAEQLHCEHELAVVPGATHLFEEPGALDAVADLAARWLGDHATRAPAGAAAGA